MTKLLKHLQLIISAEVNNPPKDPQVIDQWVLELIDKIGMKVLDGPHSLYSHDVGNRGLTTTATLNLSHMSMHCWDEISPGLINLDVYSCGHFEKETIFQHLEIFDPLRAHYTLIDRDRKLLILDEGIKIFI